MMTPVAARETLRPGTLLGSYRILKSIAKGGFSLIYLAVDENSGEEVVIKEYMPKKIASRDPDQRIIPITPDYTENLHHGRKLFFQEVKALASLKHPNIVRVLAFLLANDTGYLVMPNDRGRNLGSYLHERKGGLSTTFLLEVFVPVLDALALMHRRAMLHLDVKPGNIHLRHGNQPLLLDLGAVHPLNRGRARGGQVITAGYSPVEQYFRAGQVGPWTDVYAVGASLRTCIMDRTGLDRVFDSGLALLWMLNERLKRIGAIVVVLSDHPDIQRRIPLIMSNALNVVPKDSPSARHASLSASVGPRYLPA